MGESQGSLSSPTPTEEQKERRKWFETFASNADPRGLAGDRVHAWDREKINRDLETDTLLKRFPNGAAVPA